MPRPKVDSAVMALTPRKPACDIKSEELFFRVVTAAFCQRRKTCLNSIYPVVSEYLSKDGFAALLQDAGIDPGERAENFSVQRFALIANAIYDVK